MTKFIGEMTFDEFVEALKYIISKEGDLDTKEKDDRNMREKFQDGVRDFVKDFKYLFSVELLKDIKKYINKGFDLIKWNAVLVDENDERIDSPEQNDLVSCTGEDGFNLLYGTDKLLCCVWNYAIKKDIMIDFPEGMYHEDFRVMPFIMLNAKSMIITNKEEYFYVQSKNSIMRTSDKKKEKKKMQDILKHYDAMVKQVNKMDVENETKENMAIYATYSVLAVLNNLFTLIKNINLSLGIFLYNLDSKNILLDITWYVFIIKNQIKKYTKKLRINNIVTVAFLDFIILLMILYIPT